LEIFKVHQGTLFQTSQKNLIWSILIRYPLVYLKQNKALREGVIEPLGRSQAVIEGPPPDTHWRFAEGWGPQSGAAEAVEQALSTGCILHISLRLSQIPADP
jgi:hypothetical protein